MIRGAPHHAPWVLALLFSISATIAGAFLILDEAFIAPGWESPNASVLMMGTSHTDNATDVRLIPWDTGVLACAGADLQLLTAAYFTHRERWPNLGLVIIEVDEYTLLTDRVHARRKDFAPLADRLVLSVWDLPDRDDEWTRALWKLENLARGRGQVALQPRRRLALENAWWLWRRWTRGLDGPKRPPTEPPPVSSKTPILTEAAAVEGLRRLRKIVSDPEWNFVGLEELVRDLVTRDVEVVLVTFPTHPVYNRLRPPEWDKRIEEAVVRARAAAGGHHVERWDLRDMPFEDVDFTDLTHLDRRGAYTFTKQLVERIRRDTAFGRRAD